MHGARSRAGRDSRERSGARLRERGLERTALGEDARLAREGRRARADARADRATRRRVAGRASLRTRKSPHHRQRHSDGRRTFPRHPREQMSELPSITTSSFRRLIGVSRVDVTPPIGIYARSWGAATQDVAEGIHKPLYLTCITFASDDIASPIVLVGLDLMTWRSR